MKSIILSVLALAYLAILQISAQVIREIKADKNVHQLQEMFFKDAEDPMNTK